jgi:hypothetical protein
VVIAAAGHGLDDVADAIAETLDSIVNAVAHVLHAVAIGLIIGLFAEEPRPIGVGLGGITARIRDLIGVEDVALVMDLGIRTRS